MENIKQKTDTFVEAYNLLFNEQFKALMFVLYKLHNQPLCTWNELFEGSGLKRMGASTGTVSRAIKALEKAGIVRKEKAPFPYKAKYRLIQKLPEMDALVKLIAATLLMPEQYQELLDEWPQFAEITLLLIVKAFAEGKGSQAAFLGFALLDLAYHLAVNMPPDVQAKQLANLDKMVLEHLALTKEQLFEGTLFEKVLQAKAT
jgi:DNA-binding MarR family transcriptional regulator